MRARCRSHDYIEGRTKWSKPLFYSATVDVSGSDAFPWCFDIVSLPFRIRSPGGSGGVVSGDVRPNAASQRRDDCGTPFSKSRRQFLGLLRSHGRRRRRMMKTPFSPPRRKLTQTEANLGWQSEGLTHNSRISTSIASLGGENYKPHKRRRMAVLPEQMTGPKPKPQQRPPVADDGGRSVRGEEADFAAIR